MTFHLPSLNAVRIFEVAARHLSFVRAAAELHVTQGAVSRQIGQLEEVLGVPLFERRNRAVFLTREGVAFQLTCEQVMATLANGIRAIRRPAPVAPLVLSCEPTLAMRWLIPRLAAFRAHHPEIEVHLLAAGGAIDFQQQHVDLALRRNDFNWGADCHAQWVGQEMIAPVCAPALLDGGKLRLSRQCLLHTASRPDAWQRWGVASGQRVGARQFAHYEHFYLSLQAAGAGLGVAIASLYMVGDELASGRLAAAAGGFVEDGSAYYLLSPLPFEQDRRRQVLLAWFRQQFDASRHLPLLSV